MRDHRHLARALHARHRLVRRDLPDVRRVLVTARAPAVLVHRSTGRPELHLAIALTLAGAPARATGRTPRPVRVVTAGRSPRPATTAATPAGTPQPAVGIAARPAVRVEAVHPAARRELRQVVTVRREARVPGVERVVSRPGAAQTAGNLDLASAGQSAPPAPAAWPAPPPTVPAGPTPTELARITEHVLTAIDHRLVSYHERQGRG